VQVASSRFGKVAVAVPTGRLDHGAAAALEAALLPHANDTGNDALVVDFARVEFISSASLRVLILTANAMSARNARVAAVALQPIVAEIFAIGRFDSLFEIFPSVPAALAAMSPDARAAYVASLAANA
jgi:anti-anti-sigma factor